jgi:hypothetical protein
MTKYFLKSISVSVCPNEEHENKKSKHGNTVIKMSGVAQIKNIQAVAINTLSHCHNLLPILEEQISSSELSCSQHTYKFVKSTVVTTHSKTSTTGH